jgi:hypothetical protein
MSTKKLFGMLGAALFACSLYAADVALNPDHPDRYVVVKGDTLWDISSMYLRDPWLWPEIWYVNPQIANPHLIYPGDILTLVYVDGKPQLHLQRGGRMRLSPQIREESLESAIPTIPIDAIRQFLTRPLVVDEEDLKVAPYIVSADDQRVVTGAGDRVYVRGIEGTDAGQFDIFQPGSAFTDPDTGEVLGFEAIYVGLGAVQRFGDPATLLLTETAREARIGNRLYVRAKEAPVTSFAPRAAAAGTEGRIISVKGGVTQIGQFDVVVINRGSREGMEAGQVMKIFQAGETIRDPVSGKRGDTVQLPDEEAGVLMVFRTFDRVSYCLVMKATRAIRIHDFVRAP